MGSTPRGYPYPEPTDLVTHGAAALRSLAEALDTDVASTRAAADAAASSAVPRAVIDAAGDLLVGTGPDTVGRLAVGPVGTQLTATATGVEWRASSGTTGRQLARWYDDPATQVTYTTSATALTAIDTARYRATFVVPASGAVRVRHGGGFWSRNNTGTVPLVGLLIGATTAGRGVRRAPAEYQHTGTPLAWDLTGLTPGATVALDLAYAGTNGTYTVSYSSGGGSSTNVPPAWLEVIEL